MIIYFYYYHRPINVDTYHNSEKNQHDEAETLVWRHFNMNVFTNENWHDKLKDNNKHKLPIVFEIQKCIQIYHIYHYLNFKITSHFVDKRINFLTSNLSKKYKKQLTF